MMRNFRRFLGIIVVGGLAVGCGSASDEVGITAGSDTSDPTGPIQTTASSVTAPRSSIPPVPPVGLPDLTNANDPSTPLGALCWARREVAISLQRAMLEDLGMGTDAASSPSDLPTAMREAQRALARHPVADASQPGNAFAAHLREQLQRAQAEADTVMAKDGGAVELGRKRFAFDTYPGAETYARATASAPECPQP